MQFALLGNHPDGLAMAHALVASGRHELLAYSGPAAGMAYLSRWQITARSVGDMEEILADPSIDAVIVAGKPADRPAQLRRAVQSERHVFCVHPADDSPDIAFEAAMIQADTRRVLLPLLPETTHPAIWRLAELFRLASSANSLIEVEGESTDTVLLETTTPGQDPGIPCWDILRILGGEIIEVLGLAAEEEVAPEAPLLLAGRFERGGLFQMTLLPNQAESRWCWSVRTGMERIDLIFPEGWTGPARLTWRDELGHPREETWESFDPWPALVEVFDEAMTGKSTPRLRWQDEVRCLELDDAARRSVRASSG